MELSITEVVSPNIENAVMKYKPKQLFIYNFSHLYAKRKNFF